MPWSAVSSRVRKPRGFSARSSTFPFSSNNSVVTRYILGAAGLHNLGEARGGRSACTRESSPAPSSAPFSPRSTTQPLCSSRTVCRTVTFLTVPVSFFTSVKIRTFPRAAVTSGV